nr:hypothetical protein [Oscillibacter sp.]
MIRNRMKEHRARLGLKQEELAKLVGGPAGDHRKPGKGAVQPLSGAGLEHRQGVRGAH